jgi:hypothetical protein
LKFVFNCLCYRAPRAPVNPGVRCSPLCAVPLKTPDAAAGRCEGWQRDRPGGGRVTGLPGSSTLDSTTARERGRAWVCAKSSRIRP